MPDMYRSPSLETYGQNTYFSDSLNARKAVFSGITVSTFTPNRIGEYGGRVFCLEKGDRIKAVFITILCSMSQLLTTVILDQFL